MDFRDYDYGRMALPPEIEDWARGLLSQTLALLAKADAGEVVLPAEDVANLRKTVRDLTLMLRLDGDENAST